LTSEADFDIHADGMQSQTYSPEHLVYKPGVDRIQEAVISSHFMHKLGENAKLELYDEEQFTTQSLKIDARTLYDRLIPAILSACKAFSRKRALVAKKRATENYRKYGLHDPCDVSLAHFITEVMFDRQYLRGPRECCSRELICSKVKHQIEKGASIEMVIPALPFKISCPLKTRGQLPDLAEVNFMLELYEVALTVELLYKEARPDLLGRLARFTVISDGSRFNNLVGVPIDVVEQYRCRLVRLITRFGLNEYVTLIDYSAALCDRLPSVTRQAKTAIRQRARKEYAEALWPIFDPCDMVASTEAAARIEPDPEYSNPEGRFVSLLKSLIYTINYTALKKYERLPKRQYRSLYRELTGHLFEPFAILSPSEVQDLVQKPDGNAEITTVKIKEGLRQSMLKQAWAAAIEYMAEIKSDRELDEDPIQTCLPDCFRWTIHAKPGQLAILNSTALGLRVQAWAGTAVFKLTKDNKIKLCTLPVLALEGVGAIPVTVTEVDDALPGDDQALFYIYPDISSTDVEDFLLKVMTSYVRTRKN
jgi:hypothetical protein